jgi:hypothetical protein
MGKWQQLILDTLKRHKAFYLSDLLEHPYSLSHYNSLTRACRNLAGKGVVWCYREGGELVVSRPYSYAEPERLTTGEKIKSAKLGLAEKLAQKEGYHPRQVWRAAAFVRALDCISAVTGIDANMLAKKRTLSQAATIQAAEIATGYPEIVAEVVREAYQRDERIWRTKDLQRRILDKVTSGQNVTTFLGGNGGDSVCGTDFRFSCPRNNCGG